MENKRDIDWLKTLKKEISPGTKIVLCGVGNELRSDDGIGPAIVRLLGERREFPSSGKTTIMEYGNVLLINSGENPENFLGIIEKFQPASVIFLDATNLNSPPGTVALVSPEEIDSSTISTHRFPLSFSVDYLQKVTGAKILVLGIQPLSCQLGEGLSPLLLKACQEIASNLQEILFPESL